MNEDLPAATMLGQEVRRLIVQGHFDAAAALARGVASPWADSVQAVGRYFQGCMTEAVERAGKLPADSATRCELAPLAAQAAPKCLHVALRAEAACRANDLLAAALEAVTFQAIALLDAADACLQRTAGQTCVDWYALEIIRSPFFPGQTHVRNAVVALRARKLAWAKPFHDHDVRDWLRSDTLRIQAPWQELLLIELIEQVARKPGLAIALRELSKALHKRTKDRRTSPAHFRNILLHMLPTQAAIQALEELFENNLRLLWGKLQDGPRSFLAEKYRAHAVLEALGVPDARQRYDRLIAALVRDVEQG